MARAITRRHLLLSAPAAALALGACADKDRAQGGDKRRSASCCAATDRTRTPSTRTGRARWESMVVLRDLFEGLTRLDRNAAAIPAAAESWTTSDDGLVYVFKLRPNLRWSNGEPVVAEDFVAGMRRLVDPATASQYAQVINVILNASDIVAGKKPVDTLGRRRAGRHHGDDHARRTRRPICPGCWRIRATVAAASSHRWRNLAIASRVPASRCRMARSR